MLACEIALMVILGILLTLSSISDCKYGLIKNKHLLLCAAPAIVIDIIYYLVWGSDYFTAFLINLILLSFVATLLYAYHLWAAGDCKLIMTVALCIPGRLLTIWDIGPFASFVILIATFSFAFIYLIIETIVLDLKNKSFFKLQYKSFDWKQFLVSYTSMSAATTIISLCLSMLFPKLYSGNTTLSMAINFMIVLTLIQIRYHFSLKTLTLFSLGSWAVIILVSVIKSRSIPFSFNLRSMISVLAIMLVWSFAEKYNYQMIPTSKVKAGQIMSYSTILDFKPSRVQGLPKGQTEDLRSRITEEEAASIRRWESSSLGKPYVIIVRKIPFAVFISIGTYLFILIEVLMLWQN